MRVPVRPTSVAGALVGVTLVGLLTACAGSTTPEPLRPAEIVADGADCLTIGSLAAGSVPSGFVPVTVIECRPGPITLLDLGPFDAQDFRPGAVVEPDAVGEPVEPGAATHSPVTATPDPSTGLGGATAEPRLTPAPAEQTPPPRSVVEVVLTGDLEPLLAALARPSDPVPDDVICAEMWQIKPQILLVDDAGRAVRPEWPVTACGFLQDGASDALTRLTKVSLTSRTVPTDE